MIQYFHEELQNDIWRTLSRTRPGVIVPGEIREIPTNAQKPFRTTVVQVICGAGKLRAYGKVYHGTNPAPRMEREIAGLRRAAALDLAAPRVLARVPGADAFLMTPLPGIEMVNMLRRDPGARVDLLARAGAWLATFHEGGDPGAEPLDLRPQLAPLHGFAREARQGRRRIGHIDRYRALLDALEALQARHRHWPVQVSDQHGDASPTNIIVDGAGGTGFIDLEYGRRDLRLLDVANLLIRLQLLSPGAPFGADRAALLRGYGRDRFEGPGFRAALLLRLAQTGLEFAAPPEELPPVRAVMARRHAALTDAALAEQ